MTAHQKNCMVCNKPYIARRSDGMYCGGACKEQAFLKRNGLATPTRAELMQKNSALIQVLKMYVDFSILIFPSLKEVDKETIIKINTELKKLI